MAKGYIEVSNSLLVPNSSRPQNVMVQTDNTVEKDVRVKDAVSLIEGYGVRFSHHVESVHSGRIAVYSQESDEGRICLRLKNFTKNKLRKIKNTTQKKAVILT